ncbi:MAG: YdcF family protein [Rhodospirillaceae bacterium]
MTIPEPHPEPHPEPRPEPYKARRRRWLFRLTSSAAISMTIWLAGLIWFAETIPRDSAAVTGPMAERRTDAIIVLTGGRGRLETGLELLAAGRAAKLFISGVYHSVDVRELLRVSRQKPVETECCIVLGYAADNTAGNATETATWMRAEHFTSLRLVTGNYHMRRSLLEFRKALPEADIVPHPVAPPNVRISDWWLWRRTTGLIVIEYNKYLMALARHSVSTLFTMFGTK